MTNYIVIPAPKLKRDYPDKWVRLNRELKNQYFTVPAGTVMKIESYSMGNTRLIGPRCDCCGIAPILSGVPPRHYEFVQLIEDKT